MSPELLDRALDGLKPFRSPDLLVGFEGNADAGVFRLSDDLAIVQTVDFFTPIVDDPFTYGRIAAANALSDVYAMGAKPVTAMNIVAFPKEGMDPGILRSILQGGIAILKEAGVSLAGGHSVADQEIKYGMSITGIVHPDRLVRNTGMRPGDCLVLTKPLGTGVINTALKAGCASPESVEAAVKVMTTLNRDASSVMCAVGVHACTDITGFGFIGHLAEMVINSGVNVEIDTEAVPIIPQALEYAAMGMLPGGAYCNKEYRQAMVDADGSISDELEMLLYDPQTSGGLLISVAQDRVDELLKLLDARGVNGSMVGTVKMGTPGKIALR